MTRKDIFKVCLVAAVTMSASSAFAATITGSTVLGGGTYSPSNNVTIDVKANSTAYAAKSAHNSGDRTLFTNNSDPKMYYTTKAPGTGPSSVENATDVVSGWTTL